MTYRALPHDGGRLYPYQRVGAEFLMNRRRAYLADEMGLGKTVQAIVAAREIEAKWTLVVCPASVVENWKREWAAWGGPGKLKVISYAKLIRTEIPLIEPWSLVILDEAHYCKTPSAKRTKAAFKEAQRAERVWLLSGTPVPNDVRELYPAFNALWPHLIPKEARTAFKWMDYFCRWGENDYGHFIWGNRETVKTKLRPMLKRVMLRRKLRDVAMELPPLRYSVQYLDRDPDLQEKLAQLVTDMDDPEIMATARRLLGEYKAPKIADLLIEELKDGRVDHLVVLYHHRATGATLREAFRSRGIRTTGFDGSTHPKKRQHVIEEFQGGSFPVFLAQQTAAGVGITLTRASEIVLVEPSWSPADNDQAIKRIHRIGQERPCRARLFAVPDSLDEALMVTLKRKSEMIREAVDPNQLSLFDG